MSGISTSAASLANKLFQAGQKVASKAQQLEARGLSTEAKVLQRWSQNVAGPQGVASELLAGHVNESAAHKMVKMASDSFEFKGAVRAARGPQRPAVSFLQQLAELKDPAQLQQVRGALETELQLSVGASVVGWQTPHVEKAAFPFQVDKQAAAWEPVAMQQTRQNMANVNAVLGNPDTIKSLLHGVETRLGKAPSPIDVADPHFRKFFNAVRQNSSAEAHFAYGGTLVNVGWGSGDHVNVSSSWTPSGPRTVASRLASGILSHFQA